MKKIKKIKFNFDKGCELGELGEYAGEGFKIGDMVSLRFRDRTIVNFIVNDGYQCYFMGLKNLPLEKLVKEHEAKVILSYKFITSEIITSVDSALTIKEEEIKKLTIDQIKKELGYDFEIIE